MSSTGSWQQTSTFSSFAKRAIVAGIVLQLAFVALFTVLGIGALVALSLCGAACFAACFYLLQRRQLTASNGALLCALILNPLAGSWIAGWSCGFQYFVWVMAPLVAFNDRRNATVKYLTLAVLIAIYLTADYALRDAAPVVALPPSIVRVMRTFCIAGSLGIIGYISMLYAQTVFEAEQRFRTLATIDALTGLYNRRRLLDLATQEIQRAQRLNYSLAIIVADIDYFKRINDTYGHAAGDTVIVTVGQILQNAVRQQDHVARWGGEEFLILMPNNNESAALITAERIRESVSHMPIQNGTSTVHVTVTLGVGEWRPGESIDQAIARADAALYQGKQRGRNRTEVSDTKFAA